MPQSYHHTLTRMLAVCDQITAAAEDMLAVAENDEQLAIGLQAWEAANELQSGLEAGIEFLRQDG
jgi:hypothetical protein